MLKRLAAVLIAAGVGLALLAAPAAAVRLPPPEEVLRTLLATQQVHVLGLR